MASLLLILAFRKKSKIKERKIFRVFLLFKNEFVKFPHSIVWIGQGKKCESNEKFLGMCAYVWLLLLLFLFPSIGKLYGFNECKFRFDPKWKQYSKLLDDNDEYKHPCFFTFSSFSEQKLFDYAVLFIIVNPCAENRQLCESRSAMHGRRFCRFLHNKISLRVLRFTMENANRDCLIQLINVCTRYNFTNSTANGVCVCVYALVSMHSFFRLIIIFVVDVENVAFVWNEGLCTTAATETAHRRHLQCRVRVKCIVFSFA